MIDSITVNVSREDADWLVFAARICLCNTSAESEVFKKVHAARKRVRYELLKDPMDAPSAPKLQLVSK